MLQLLNRLLSLERELLTLKQEVEENRRAAANIIRLGYVNAATENAVNVTTGDNLATGIPFFVLASGRVSQYRRPSLGEQCLLLNLGSGDNLNNAVALMGLPSSQYPCPTTAENEVMTDYGNGMTELYDLDSGQLTANYPGGLIINADMTHTGNMEHTGSVNRTGDTILTGNTVSTGNFNHLGGFAVAGGPGGGAATISGGMAITGGDVSVEGLSLTQHHHDDAESRPTSKAKP
ncbi:phage baseplate assembly protein V [Photobacterium halotolerans]|uniref:phage baseplate assembly protein V n=1 Tax=Photobacterium halotolerans TaxID=265726 RepID=UPI001F00E588|nr:phage baseplate assembly protein V [Photobacterium halotolerans]